MKHKQGFEPTEIWNPQAPNFSYEEAIENARREINSKNPDKLIHDLKQQTMRSDNDVVYAELKGDHPDEYSDTDALVMFNPFANTATANMLVRAEFIREVAKQADVRDEQGKLKPVIMLASPGLFGSKLWLDSKDKKEIRNGNLGPAAKEYLKAVSYLGIGRIALLGYSQGADMAIAGARSAYVANLDSNELSIGDPASVKRRKLNSLAQDFFKAAPDIEARASESGLAALDEARGIKSDYLRFVLSAPFPSNIFGMAMSMTSNSFEKNMQEIIDEGRLEKIVVAYGDRSTIAPPLSIEPALDRLHSQVHGKEKITSIKISNGTHAWGEQLTVLAKLYLRALV